MPDSTEATQDGNTSGETSAAEEFAPITTQEALNAALKDRLERERSKFKDYGAIKAKAAKLDEIEQANQSELEKANTRTTAAESEREAAKSEAMRLRIAVEHGISLEDADLFLTGTDEESIRAQAKRLSDREADRKKNGNVASKEGTNTRPAENEERAFARGLFGE